MKLFNKISKSGIFCDKKVEHFTLIQLRKPKNYSTFVESGAVEVVVPYYSAELLVDVGIYEDGIVRLIAYLKSDTQKQELGRLLLSEADFVGNLSHLAKGGK